MAKPHLRADLDELGPRGGLGRGSRDPELCRRRATSVRRRRRAPPPRRGAAAGPRAGGPGAAQEALLDRTRERGEVGDSEAARELRQPRGPCGSSSSASGLPRVSATIRSRTRSSMRPAMTSARSAWASASARPSSNSSGSPTRSASELGSRIANTSATGSARSAPGDETQDLAGGTVEPLGVVDDAEERLLLGGFRQQSQRPEGDEEAVRRVPGRDAERDAQRALLRLWESARAGRASAHRAGGALRTAAPSRTRRRRYGQPGSQRPDRPCTASGRTFRRPPRRG